MNPAVAISLTNVTFGYSGERLYDSFSVEIPENSFFAVIGKSGSAKTTLLKLLTGVETPSSGTISIRGMTPRDARKAHVLAVSPQNPALLPWLSIRANIEMAFQMWGEPVDSAVVNRVLEMVGLSDSQTKRPSQLSGGMKARAALARAWCAPGRPILLLDEPFASVDEMLRDELTAALESLVKNDLRTVIYVTHSISEAISLSSHLLLLANHTRRGQPTPIVISKVQQSLQKKRDRTVLHRVLQASFVDAPEIWLSGNLFDEYRGQLRPEDEEALVALLDVKSIPAGVRCNIAALLKDYFAKLTITRLSLMVGSDSDLLERHRAKALSRLISLWHECDGKGRSLLLFRIADLVISDLEFDFAFDWLRAPPVAELFIACVREYVSQRGLTKHVKQRLSENPVPPYRATLHLTTLAAATRGEQAGCSVLLDDAKLNKYGNVPLLSRAAAFAELHWQQLSAVSVLSENSNK